MKEIKIKTHSKTEIINITSQVSSSVVKSGFADGVAYIFCPHTTAGITINESYDPDVLEDINNHLSKMVPPNGNFSHSEGNSDGHIKSALVNSSQVVFIEGSKLVLGTWQGIFFCEFDGPRSRKVWIKTLGN